MAIRFSHKLLLLFCAGFVISFLGALPLGSLNLTASQIYGASGAPKTMLFISTVTVIELLVVLGLIMGLGRLPMGKKHLAFAIPVAIVLLVYLSYTVLFTGELPTGPMDVHHSNTLQQSQTSTIALGIVLGLGNPAQFPFWAGWNNWLYRKNMLGKDGIRIMAYLLGIGSGTIIGMYLVVHFVHRLQAYLPDYDFIFTGLLGLLYLGLAIYLVRYYHRHFLRPIYEAHV